MRPMHTHRGYSQVRIYVINKTHTHTEDIHRGTYVINKTHAHTEEILRDTYVINTHRKFSGTHTSLIRPMDANPPRKTTLFPVDTYLQAQSVKSQRGYLTKRKKERGCCQHVHHVDIKSTSRHMCIKKNVELSIRSPRDFT